MVPTIHIEPTNDDGFCDVRHRAEEMSCEKNMPVKFEWDGYFYTVERIVK